MMRVAVAMLLVALSGYPVLAQQPYMVISVFANMVGSSRPLCKISLYVLNQGHVTLDDITLHVTVENSGGDNLGTTTESFRYVDPDKSVSSSFSIRSHCNQVTTMTIREVTSCRFGGKRYRGCEKLIRDRKFYIHDVMGK